MSSVPLSCPADCRQLADCHFLKLADFLSHLERLQLCDQNEGFAKGQFLIAVFLRTPYTE